jgi:membrane protease YdiL (CAAX protease family)
VAIAGFLILAVLRRVVEGVLPSYGSLALVFLGIVAQAGSLFLGMFIGGHFQSPIGLWVGKLASVGGTLLFIWLCKSQASWRDMGFRSSRPKTIGLTSGLFVVMAGITWFLAHCYAPKQEFSPGAFAFMLLLSGTDEEFLFRGAMPALLRRADVTERQQRTVNAGLVFAIPTMAFMLMHGLRYVDQHFAFSWQVFALAGLGGCILMCIRLSTRSVWPSLIVHNMVNAGSVVAMALWR